jgi:RNA polymerase sigma-70 factor (ECF subfamily)
VAGTLTGGQNKTLDDAALVAQVARGDRQALAELIRRHQQRVLHVAIRVTGDPHLARDIAQETFLRAWGSAGRYTPSARVGTWLYRIVVNLCLDELKRKRPATGRTTLTPEPDEEDEESGRSAVETAELASAVRQAVAQLPERQRVALILHRFSDLTLREIAVATGWTESAVESLLTRAYAALRQSLGRFRVF